MYHSKVLLDMTSSFPPDSDPSFSFQRSSSRVCVFKRWFSKISIHLWSLIWWGIVDFLHPKCKVSTVDLLQWIWNKVSSSNFNSGPPKGGFFFLFAWSSGFFAVSQSVKFLPLSKHHPPVLTHILAKLSNTPSYPSFPVLRHRGWGVSECLGDVDKMAVCLLCIFRLFLSACVTVLWSCFLNFIPLRGSASHRTPFVHSITLSPLLTCVRAIPIECVLIEMAFMYNSETSLS